MKNRAKCRLCDSIIESYHASDYVSCKCGAIAVDKGPAMWAYAQDWKDFLRVDDNGNEIIVTVKASNEQPLNEKPNKAQMLDMLTEMRKSCERLPDQALTQPVTNLDYISLLILLESLFRAD